MSCRGPDIVATKVYFPEDGEIQVHQSRVCACPAGFPAGYFWYGGRRKGPGRPPKWVEKLLEGSPDNSASPNVDEQETADGSDSSSQDVEEPDTANESVSDDEDDPIVQKSPGLDVPKTRTRTRTINPPERYM